MFSAILTGSIFIQFYTILFFPYVQKFKHFTCPHPKYYTYYYHRKRQEPTVNIHSPKPRLIVLTDISSLQPGCGEPDDTQSLIRLLLYSDLLDIEGLIATYSSHIKVAVKTDYLETIVRHYEKVWDNLLLHSADYPDPTKLLEGIRAGSLYCGMEIVGEGKDTRDPTGLSERQTLRIPGPSGLPSGAARQIWRRPYGG